MKKSGKLIIGILFGFIFIFATSAFIISDPKADMVKEEVNESDQVALADISTGHTNRGNFKSSVKIREQGESRPEKEFYGQEITIEGNPRLDRILVGVTNNLISRIEIWNKEALVATKEIGFMNKMTRGATQTMTVDFYDQTNRKYPGKSRLTMRFYKGTGFLGDIGTINMDLTAYGDLSGQKSIQVFAKSMGTRSVHMPLFTHLSIWKNYTSFD